MTLRTENPRAAQAWRNMKQRCLAVKPGCTFGAIIVLAIMTFLAFGGYAFAQGGRLGPVFRERGSDVVGMPFPEDVSERAVARHAEGGEDCCEQGRGVMSRSFKPEDESIGLLIVYAVVFLGGLMFCGALGFFKLPNANPKRGRHFW